MVTPFDLVNTSQVTIPQIESQENQVNLTKSQAKTIKRIPRASRTNAARKLASVIEEVVALNDLASWNRLFLFLSRCLRAPPRGGRRWNVTRAIKNQIREETDPPPIQNRTNRLRRKQIDHPDLMDALATRVSEKLENGDYRGAIRIACSQDSVAEKNEVTWRSLQLKHPEPHQDTLIPTASTEDDISSSILVTETNAIQAIHHSQTGLPLVILMCLFYKNIINTSYNFH